MTVSTFAEKPRATLLCTMDAEALPEVAWRIIGLNAGPSHDFSA
jgi:hypothetical protein